VARPFPGVRTSVSANREKTLLKDARAGDREALGELYRLHSRRVYNLTLRMTGDPAEAADLAQDAFLKAFGAIESFRGDSGFGTWLHRIAVNTVRDHFRKRRPQPTDEDSLERLVEAADVPRASRNPVEDRLSDEVTAALTALPEDFRLTVVLCDLLDYSYAEAADILEIAEGTVKSRLFRARALLARSLAPSPTGAPLAEAEPPDGHPVGAGDQAGTGPQANPAPRQRGNPGLPGAVRESGEE